MYGILGFYICSWLLFLRSTHGFHFIGLVLPSFRISVSLWWWNFGEIVVDLILGWVTLTQKRKYKFRFSQASRSLGRMWSWITWWEFTTLLHCIKKEPSPLWRHKYVEINGYLQLWSTVYSIRNYYLQKTCWCIQVGVRYIWWYSICT